MGTSFPFSFFLQEIKVVNVLLYNIALDWVVNEICN